MGGGDDGLGAEMENHLDLMLNDRAFDGTEIFKSAVHDRTFLYRAAAEEVALWIVIRDQCHNIRPKIEQASG